MINVNSDIESLIKDEFNKGQNSDKYQIRFSVDGARV